jgi:hypothetical protein
MNNEYYLYGLQRSGTNYLRKLIELNFNFYTRNKKSPRSWKHRLDVPDIAKDHVNIILYKNPYKWIESLYRNPEDFFEKQTKFPCLNEDGSYNLTAIAKTYRHFIETWVFSGVSSLNIRYEDLLENKPNILNSISHLFNATFSKYNIIEPGTVLNSRKFTDDKKEYYLKDNSLKFLTKEQLDEVNNILDSDFMLKLNYEKLK